MRCRFTIKSVFLLWHYKIYFVISQNKLDFVKTSSISWYHKITLIFISLIRFFDITKSIFDITKSNLWYQKIKLFLRYQIKLILWYQKQILRYHKICKYFPSKNDDPHAKNKCWSCLIFPWRKMMADIDPREEGNLFQFFNKKYFITITLNHVQFLDKFQIASLES